MKAAPNFFKRRKKYLWAVPGLSLSPPVVSGFLKIGALKRTLGENRLSFLYSGRFLQTTLMESPVFELVLGSTSLLAIIESLPKFLIDEALVRHWKLSITVCTHLLRSVSMN
ncbi:MAG: hypothetical protein U0V70_16440 [Terriglobia bacterium]